MNTCAAPPSPPTPPLPVPQQDGLATPLPTVGGTSSGRRSSTTSLPELPGSVSSTAATAPTAARCPSVAITTAALAPSQESSPRGPTGRPPLPPRHTRGLPPRASSGGGSGPTAYAADPAPTSSGQKRLRADEEDDVDGHMQECGDGAAEQSPTPVRGAAAPPGTCGAAGGDVSSWASMMQHLASSYYQEYGSVPDVPSHLDAVRQQTKRQRTAGGGGPGAPAKAQPAVPAGPAPQLGAM